VDACSALEDAPGTKNHDKVRAFVKSVRSVKP
jgi:phosphoribosylanthranilate isomerase